MPERRRVSLRAICLVGLLCCLGGAGCLQVMMPTQKAAPTNQTVLRPNNQEGQLIVRTAAVGPSAVKGPTAEQPLPLGPNVPGPGACGPNGCGLGGQEVPPPGFLARELTPMALPPYMVEPPDILLLDTIKMVPKPPYVVSPLDVLLVRVAEPLPNQPIDGAYTVAPDGTINLGYSYGLVRVGGLGLGDVERAIRRQVGRVLKNPQVVVGLAQFRGAQQVRGQHLVRPDGTLSLGSYGCVFVAGLRLDQVKVAIERHLSQFVLDPEVSVDVLAYNSKVYYVITDGAGYGEQVYRFPITGKETVLDGISNIQGLPAVASKRKIWLARPSPAGHPCSQVLPVDWMAITQAGSTGTNYQLFPGDRIYVGPNPLIKADNVIAQVLSPFQRIFGLGFIATSTFNNLRNNGNGTGTTAAAVILPGR